jgi:far upstream element-binding protein
MKNSGGGGRRQDKGSQQLDYGDRSYQQSSYGAAQSQPTQAPGAGAAGAEDPYAAYGGYQAYVALWYQAMAAQQQAGQPQGDPTKPPGTA